MSGGIDAGGDWSISFQPDQCFRCFAVISGACWLQVEGTAEPVHLQAGDFIALPHGRSFCLASQLDVPSTDILTVLQSSLKGCTILWNGGGACLALSALFTFTGGQTQLLLQVLPPYMRVRSEADRSTLRWYLERMMEVAREARPGGVLLGEHLAQMLLIELLRLHLEDSAPSTVGWLFALADKQLAAAMNAIHSEPGRRWTLQALATTAGMSRSAFALRFKKKVGSSAMAYVLRWRMLLAADRLANTDQSVAAIAVSLGYESESAFGFAFRREMGCSPRQLGRSPTRT